MNKKSNLTIKIAILSLLLVGCRRGVTPTSSSSQPIPSSSSITSGISTSGTTTNTTVTTATSGKTTITTSGKTSSTSSTRPTTTSSSEPEPGDYYASISDNLSGDDLLYALHSLNDQHRTHLTYEALKTFLPICDVNPDNSSEMIGFYDNARLPTKWDSAKTWNREHVWPDARGGGASDIEGDAFMPRPCSVGINSSRGSKGYGYASYDPYTDKKITNKVAYYRGVCARIVFYCLITKPDTLKICDDIYDRDYPFGQKNTMATLSDLLEWNLMYLPSDKSLDKENDLARRVEINRNEVIYSHKDGQGNRNPFVDHPSYACRIWGNYNDKTKAICGM